MSNVLSKLSHGLIKKMFYKAPLEGEMCTEIIKKELLSEKATMIARFGSIEIKAILYPNFPFFIRLFLKKRVFQNMFINAGFFPSDELNIRKFSQQMFCDMKLLDILGSWRIEERFLEKHYTKAIRVTLNTLEPYFHNEPWTEVLENKKVLVIHPFNKTIESQYLNKRELLFKDYRVLPKFKSLETIKAVQSIAGNKSEFNDWFEALEYMKAEIDKKDFDIAIIGCGAYGFPLAAHVKRKGKKAVHLGGATQILFGIKGKRWIENPKFKDIINEHFVFPSSEDQVVDANKVENGCYW